MRIPYSLYLLIIFLLIPTIFPFVSQAENVFSNDPIPCGEDAVTRKKFRGLLFSWWKKQVLEPYKKKNLDKLESLKPKLTFLEEYCRFRAGCFGAKSADDLFEMGKAHLKTKAVVKDPMADFTDESDKELADAVFDACMGDVMMRRGKKYAKRSEYIAAKGILGKAYEDLEPKDYPKALRLTVADSLSKAAYKINRRNFTAEYNKAFSLMLELLKEKYSSEPIDARALHNLFFSTLWMSWDGFLKQLHTHAKKRKMSDKSWLFNMLSGHVANKNAWKARGGGWASGVSKDGWKKFKKYETEAGVSFRRAWKIHPDCPEAPGRLIGIAMAGHTLKDEDQEFWFNQSVKAQMDYHTAYHKYFWALRPRWGGSHRAMINLGMRAYNTKRFDTNAPRYLIYALLNVSEESLASNWRLNFRIPAVKKCIDDIYGKMIPLADSVLQKDMLNLEYAFCKAWMGEYDSAKELYEKTPSNIPLKSLFFGQAKRMMRSRKVFLDELAVFTGKSGALARKWEELVLVRNKIEARKLENELLDPEKTDMRTMRYVLDRVTMNNLNWGARTIPNHTTVLGHAIYKKNSDAALRLIKAGVDINEMGPNNWSPLHYATRHNVPEVARELIEKGARLDLLNPEDWSPLDLTARYGTVEIMKLLLERKVDHNAPNGTYSPLHLSIESDIDRLGKVKLLIEYKTNLNSINNLKRTPLHHAAIKGDLQAVKMLVDAGTDTTLRDRKGKTAADLTKNDAIKKLLE